jgi:hypothetical protein
MAYGFFFMASYPIVEAGVMHAVHDSVRGRAFGLWITIGAVHRQPRALAGRALGGRFWPTGVRKPEDLLSALCRTGALILVLSLAGLPCLERVTTPGARAN